MQSCAFTGALPPRTRTLWIRASASWTAPTMCLFARRSAACVAQCPLRRIGAIFPSAVRKSFFPKVFFAKVTLHSLSFVACVAQMPALVLPVGSIVPSAVRETLPPKMFMASRHVFWVIFVAWPAINGFQTVPTISCTQCGAEDCLYDGFETSIPSTNLMQII